MLAQQRRPSRDRVARSSSRPRPSRWRRSGRPAACRRDRGAHRVDDLEQQPDAVLEAAAVLVVAVVGQRREELVQQVAVRGVDLDHVEAGRERPRARRRANAVTTSAMPVGGRARRGLGVALGTRSATGPTGCQPPSASATAPRPAHGRLRRGLAAGVRELDAGGGALAVHEVDDPAPGRPAARRSRCPGPAGEIRPSGTTAVASVITSPAPPRATARGGRGASRSGTPSTAEYWHIGETQTRLRTLTSRRAMGVKSWLMVGGLRNTGAGRAYFVGPGARTSARRAPPRAGRVCPAFEPGTPDSTGGVWGPPPPEMEYRHERTTRHRTSASRTTSSRPRARPRSPTRRSSRSSTSTPTSTSRSTPPPRSTSRSPRTPTSPRRSTPPSAPTSSRSTRPPRPSATRA